MSEMQEFSDFIVRVYNNEGAGAAARQLQKIINHFVALDTKAFAAEIDAVKSLFTLTDAIAASTTAKGVVHMVTRVRNEALESVAKELDELGNEARSNGFDDEDYIIGNTYKKAARVVREKLS